MEGFFIVLEKRRGQAMVEILVALTIAVIVIGGVTALVIVSMRSNTETNFFQVSSSLGQDLIDSVKSAAEQDWHQIYDLNKGAGNNYYISTTTKAIIGGTETVLSGGKSYSRYFYAENTRRTSCGLGDITSSATTSCNILDMGPSYVAEDPSTQKITVVVSGDEDRSNSFIQYVSRTRNKTFIQTNWGGGLGQESFSTTSQGAVVNDKFATSTENVDFTSQPGSIKLILP